MNEKYTILVVNGIFEEENLLIIKSKGSQSIKRFDETITPEILRTDLEGVGIDIGDCKIVVLDKDWKGNPKVEQF